MNTATNINVSDLLAEIEVLKTQNAVLVANRRQPKVKVNTETGTIMVLNLRKFPVSLYREEWLKVLDLVPQIQAAIDENKSLIDALETKKGRIQK